MNEEDNEFQKKMEEIKNDPKLFSELNELIERISNIFEGDVEVNVIYNNDVRDYLNVFNEYDVQEEFTKKDNTIILSDFIDKLNDEDETLKLSIDPIYLDKGINQINNFLITTVDDNIILVPIKNKIQMKKKIGIDINEILRARSLQFDRFYVEEFGVEGAPDEDSEYSYNFRNDYKWEDSEEETKYLNPELPDNISPLDYQLDEKGESAIDSFAFRPEKKHVTADEKYKRFLYEDYVFEIFGSAPPMYKNQNLHVEKFFLEFKDEFDIVLVSKENWFTIPPTLFFLSKIMPRFKQYLFAESNEEIWDNIDVLITTDPELLRKPTEDKIVVKMNRPYNQSIESFDFEGLQLVDLVGNNDFREKLNLKPIEKKEEKLIENKKLEENGKQ